VEPTILDRQKTFTEYTKSRSDISKIVNIQFDYFYKIKLNLMK
jgi:hypothetical protein